jgi:hypothetical protein
MFGDSRTAAQQRCDEAFAQGKQKALEDPVALSFLREMADLVPHLATDEEYNCWKAGYQAGLKEASPKARERRDSNHNSTSPAYRPGHSGRKRRPRKNQQLPPEFFYSSTTASTPARKSNPMIETTVWSMLLIVCYITGIVIAIEMGSRRQDIDIRLPLMLFGPLFWTGLVYFFTEKRSNKFLKWLTIFAALFAVASHYTRFNNH